jgi:hypothetical protein
MEDLKLQVAAFQQDLGVLAKELAAKHNLTLAKNFIRYDQFEFNASLKFNITAKVAEKKAHLADIYSNEGDPKVGDILHYRRTGYKVTGYNRNGTLLADRNVDGRSFKFKRNKVTFKYDYFDAAVVA